MQKHYLWAFPPVWGRYSVCVYWCEYLPQYKSIQRVRFITLASKNAKTRTKCSSLHFYRMEYSSHNWNNYCKEYSRQQKLVFIFSTPLPMSFFFTKSLRWDIFKVHGYWVLQLIRFCQRYVFLQILNLKKNTIEQFLENSSVHHP